MFCSVKSISLTQECDVIDLCCSSSDEKSLAVQSISVTSDDTKHVNTDSTSSLSEDSDEEIEYYDGTEALPIFKSGWKENTLTAMAIAQHLSLQTKMMLSVLQSQPTFKMTQYFWLKY